MVTAWSAFINPTFEWDAFSIWQLKAKVLFLQPMTPRPEYFSDITLSYSHLRYPLLVPMVSAGLHTFTGNFRDESGQSAFLIPYLGLGAVIYTALRDRRGALPAITATTLLLTLPLLMRFATSGTAEMALESFYACSLISILHWQEKQKTSDLILATLFSICMTWTKNEGIALAAINFAVILFLSRRPFSRRNITAAFALLICVVLFYLPWLIWSRGLPRTDEDYAGHLSAQEIIAHLDRIPTIIAAFADEMVLRQNVLGAMKNWGAFWIVLALLTIIKVTRLRSRPVYTLWICLLLHAGAYVLAYIITPLNLKNLLADSMDRLVLHLTSAAALIIGLTWPVEPPTAAKTPGNKSSR
jgi:4-amino-4-deoxy-L-arabinose transferase-like glycosyltransferase